MNSRFTVVVLRDISGTLHILNMDHIVNITGPASSNIRLWTLKTSIGELITISHTDAKLFTPDTELPER